MKFVSAFATRASGRDSEESVNTGSLHEQVRYPETANDALQKGLASADAVRVDHKKSI
jgi:hypothetical protein